METLFLVLRVVVSLAAVLALLWYLQRRLGKNRGVRASRRAVVTVVGRQSLGSKASVAVVELDGTRFLLGVTDAQVTVLHSGDAPEPVVEDEQAATPGALAFQRASGSILDPASWSQAARALRQAK